MVAVVLLGAGASFGSGETFPERPPLGKALFGKLEQLGGLAATLPEPLKEIFREDFERGMAEFAQAGLDIGQFQRELAAYIAQFTPGPANVYHRLVRALGISKVVYCSLNYDLLLEQAAANFGINPNYGLERPTANFIRLLKPHGSSNFWPMVGGDQYKDVMFVNCAHDINCPVKVLNQVDTQERCRVETTFSPAMSMFAVGKAVRTCPEYVTRQQEQWAEVIERGRSIFVVGVRVHPVDTHIWGIIAKSKASLFYYGVSDQDEAEFNAWVKDSGRKDCRFLRADFAQSVPLMRMQIHGFRPVTR